jgi:DNA-binding NarL/FixJ family response regulator
VDWRLDDEERALKPSKLRILVVEDFEPFRRWVSSLLQDKLDAEVIEVGDGLEAVQKANELQPELILLDIGLPRLNGIMAARRIRALAPSSKILFLSPESSPDVMQEAFRLGAGGYVLKVDAGSHLLAAVNAVLRGETFVGSKVAEPSFTKGPHDIDLEESSRVAASTPLPPPGVESAPRHEAGFYSDDRHIFTELTQFIGAALQAGDAGIVIATEPHRRGLIPRLEAYGVDIAAAIEQGRYLALDATDTLSAIMRQGAPDPVRFRYQFGDVIETAAKAGKGQQPCRVALFGECADLLCEQGNVEAAIQLERLGNELTKQHDVSILCAYSLDRFLPQRGNPSFERICAEHSGVHLR